MAETAIAGVQTTNAKATIRDSRTNLALNILVLHIFSSGVTIVLPSLRDNPPSASPHRWMQDRMGDHKDVGQATSGLEKPATSLTRSAWRLAPVFSNRRQTWVLTVLSAS